MVAPPPLLQTPEEFRRQGHLYRGIKWISYDEGRPNLGVEEGVFKLFVSGGPLCLWGKIAKRRPTSRIGPDAGKVGP